METPERYWTCIGPAVRKRVARSANVANESWMQDWPCEVADVARMADFLAGYREAGSDDERFAWMCLCLESLAWSAEGVDTYWAQVEPLLREAPMVHAHSILEWAYVGLCADGRWRFEEPESALSAVMRRVLLDVQVSIGFDEFDANDSDPT